ncbi:oligosaccharide flippase family protein [Candidatus Accumulibacter sp. ACC003]|uniref:oligosaccharide flippase family protein n=1 Tax=Candidatus Accumulibacter sp. ACC003 TaxID=2823334 RepID=UPI0025B8BADA|nr:oligosaccharide flippase family protein [Candidatus Accumulibacter sp. ACC003]
MLPLNAAALRSVVRLFRERLLSGFALNFLSAVALQGSVLLTAIVLARLLGLEDFGIYAVLVSTVMISAGIAQGATGLVGTKFVGELMHTDPGQIARILRMCALMAGSMGLLMALLLFVLAPTIAADVLAKPQVEPFLRWVSAAIVLQVLVTYQYGALQGFGAFRQMSVAGIVAGLAHLGCSVAGAWFGGLTGAAIGFVAASAVRALVFTVTLRGVCRQHAVPAATAISWDDWRRFSHFALPASLASYVTLPCLWGVTALVARQPDGLAWVALFSVAHQVRLAAIQMPALLNAVSFSALSRLKGQGERGGFRQVFWTNMIVSVCFTSALVAVLALFSKEILGLYGAQFVQGSPVLLVMLLAVIPETLGLAAYQLVQSSGRMWQSLFLIVGPRDLLYLLLSSIWISSYGLTGAASAYLVAYTLGCVATILVARFDGALIRPASASE